MPSVFRKATPDRTPNSFLQKFSIIGTVSAETIPFQEIESKWQKFWEDQGFFRAPQTPRPGKKFYCLVMFPYPSGTAHMGHFRNYTLADVAARRAQMEGYDVLHPIGWDGFGLPAENAAIQHKIDAAQWTRDNICRMREQFRSWGLSYDWSREFATCDPRYYRWNQQFFIQMFHKGLAYQKHAPVNFCPKCQTVLANEQVGEAGECWRCQAPVVQKHLRQWFLKLSQYAEELLRDMRELEGGWSAYVLQMQRNWIGKSEGAEIYFEIADCESRIADFKIENPEIRNPKLTIFTTRPDTLFGATFMVLAPEHPWVEPLTVPDQKAKVHSYMEQTKKKSLLQRTRQEGEKEGVFTGSYALHPATQEKIPLWVSDYVLMEYGTGAIMAVPAHDARDFEFAKKHRLPIRYVIFPKNRKNSEESAYEEEGILRNSGAFDGLSNLEAKGKIVEQLARRKLAQPKIQYHLKDWLISRQRAWGTPIPILHCPQCGAVPVPQEQLPVQLPPNIPYGATGESPLTRVESFVKASCPKCRGAAKRETDTMDTFVDSSWYYARYCDPKNEKEPFDKKTAQAWLPVDLYIGGIEHACMHLIYARFFHKVLRDLGWVNSPEPFPKLLNQGMVTLGGTAMSKSKGNTVDPQGMIRKYGADTLRLFILFAAPPEKNLEWSEEGVEGCLRFLNRIWRKVLDFSSTPKAAAAQTSAAESLTKKTHRTIEKVTQDLRRLSFNTAIASLMELTNSLYAYQVCGDETSGQTLKTLVRLLYPFAPHVAEEMWSKLGETQTLVLSPWPQANPAKLSEAACTLAVQVNGRFRDRVQIQKDADAREAQNAAQDRPKIRRHLGSQKISKVIFVPNKLINLITENNASAAKVKD
ncbi:MAG: leucine--tRNA ligase [Elusimicrobia bacterium]|nr:leucine--tRNA ligase [Elusimicrobiota bacterium]